MYESIVFPIILACISWINDNKCFLKILWFLGPEIFFSGHFLIKKVLKLALAILKEPLYSLLAALGFVFRLLAAVGGF